MEQVHGIMQVDKEIGIYIQDLIIVLQHGLWVAKFEASRSNATSGSEGSANTIKIRPGVQSWSNISVNDIYNTCLNYNASLNSHMMKNTEWGVCTYLAQSSYGKNADVWTNPNSYCLTGHAGNGANVKETTATSAYNTGNGPQASTTGNVYGVYDMSGGAYEYVAAYVNNGNSNLTQNGFSLYNGASYTKDVYVSSGDTSEGNYNAASGKYGDAIYETSFMGTGGPNAWYGDIAAFPCTSYAFFIRGGGYNAMSGRSISF